MVVAQPFSQLLLQPPPTQAPTTPKAFGVPDMSCNATAQLLLAQDVQSPARFSDVVMKTAGRADQRAPRAATITNDSCRIPSERRAQRPEFFRSVDLRSINSVIAPSLFRLDPPVHNRCHRRTEENVAAPATKPPILTAGWFVLRLESQRW